MSFNFSLGKQPLLETGNWVFQYLQVLWKGLGLEDGNDVGSWQGYVDMHFILPPCYIYYGIYTMASMGVLSDYNLYKVLSSVKSRIEPRYCTSLQIRNALVTRHTDKAPEWSWVSIVIYHWEIEVLLCEDGLQIGKCRSFSTIYNSLTDPVRWTRVHK